jgi:hypothetical protein
MGSSEDIPEDAGFWWKLVHLNPTLYRGLIIAIAGVLAYLGIGFAVGFQDSIFTLVISVVAIVQALWTKSAVTANQKVVVYKPDPVESPNVLASGQSISYDEAAVAHTAAHNDALVVAES